MKTASLKELKTALDQLSHPELLTICVRLAKLKKDNKELLTYLLFEAQDEAAFIEGVKAEVETQFRQINTSTYYWMKKSIRKILRYVKAQIRYSAEAITEVELRIHFCEQLLALKPSIKKNTVLNNLYLREVAAIQKKVKGLHEDLQFDYQEDMDKLTS